MVARTIYALRKIKSFNHDYFSPEEARTLDPVATGLLSLSLQFTFSTSCALTFIYLWKNWSFNRRSALFMGSIFALSYGTKRVPNFVSEHLKMYSRRNLAERYLEAYGELYFHRILNPNFNLHELKSLKNNLI